jgi:hypothetical protein
VTTLATIVPFADPECRSLRRRGYSPTFGRSRVPEAVAGPAVAVGGEASDEALPAVRKTARSGSRSKERVRRLAMCRLRFSRDRGPQALKLPAIRPFTKCRCRTMKKIRTGNEASVLAARVWPQTLP